MIISIFLFLLPFIQFSDELNNGLGRTPQMGKRETELIYRKNFGIFFIIEGWNSWNHFHCGINETVVRQTADTIVATGLAAVGYEYGIFVSLFFDTHLIIFLLLSIVNMDDCWQWSRDAQGTIQPDPTTFPSGIPALVDYVHSRKLKFGLYSGV